MDEIIGQKFPQKCGDTLLVIEKTSKKNKDGSFFLRCKFLKYPYEIFISDRYRIKKGTILNPLLEEKDFVGKTFLQHCGDSLKVIKKTTKKDNSGHILYECIFIKYPYKGFFPKGNILKRTINNPQIEKIEFIDKIWHQNCGDDLKILEKSDKKEGTTYLWRYTFVKYPCVGVANKKNIINGQIDNPNLPWKSKKNFEKFLKSLKRKVTLKELSEILKLSHHTLCNLINEYDLRNYLLYYPTSSFTEKELSKYIASLGVNIETSNWDILNGKEIDIYIPSKKIGFEFNGNYWHSDLYKENLYHQQKSLLAQANGINLVHIWEWEWNNCPAIKGYIKKRLGIFDYIIGARECNVKKISIKEYKDFCNKYHLQGFTQAKITLGLFYKEKLVEIMSFDSPRFTDKYEWEIIRECSRDNYCILGGKEKIWFYFLKNYSPKSCISYCDFAKFTGESYLKLGFKKEKLNYPGFVWYDRAKEMIYLRTPWKHQEMKEKGYLKIYDCGQFVFVWNYSK